VKELEVTVRRGGVEVVVKFLDVFAVVPFGVVEAEQAFLQGIVAAVPQGERNAESLFVIGEAGQAIFPPAVGAGVGMLVREEIPGVARAAVIFADRTPLAFGEV